MLAAAGLLPLRGAQATGVQEFLGKNQPPRQRFFLLSSLKLAQVSQGLGVLGIAAGQLLPPVANVLSSGPCLCHACSPAYSSHLIPTREE